MKLTDYRYVYNAAAHFAAAERYPDGLVQAMMQPTAAGFEALCFALAEMAARGEEIRRYMGADKRKVPDMQAFMAEMMPYQIPEAKALVMQAITRGLSAPKGEETEIDEVLMELEKKTGAGG